MTGLALWLGIAVAPSAVDWGAMAQLRTESRLSVLPAATGERITTFGAELTPTVGVGANSATSELGLQYAPQLQYSFDGGDVVPLHRATASARTALSRRLAVFATGTGIVGELDTIRARLLLDPERGEIITVPENTTVGYANGSVDLGLTHAATRTLAWEARLSLGHTGPRSDGPATALFRKQEGVTLQASATYAASARHTLRLEGERSWVWFEGGPYHEGLTPALSYEHALGRRLSLDARLGALISATTFGANQLSDGVVGEGAAPPRRGTERRYLPVASVSLEGPWLRRRGLTAHGRVAASLLAFHDSTDGSLEQRSAVAASCDLTLPRGLTARLDAALSVPVGARSGTRTPSDGGGVRATANQDALVTLAAGLAYPVAPALDLELGGLATERFEDYTKLGGDWSRPELAILLAITVRAGAT